MDLETPALQESDKEVPILRDKTFISFTIEIKSAFLQLFFAILFAKQLKYALSSEEICDKGKITTE
jgi:hypothetical protein